MKCVTMVTTRYCTLKFKEQDRFTRQCQPMLFAVPKTCCVTFGDRSFSTVAPKQFATQPSLCQKKFKSLLKKSFYLNLFYSKGILFYCKKKLILMFSMYILYLKTRLYEI